MWEGLEQDLNYNVMISQRGILNLDPFLTRSAMPLSGAATR